MGAIFLSDPDRPGLEMGASYGMDAASVARLSAAVADPGHPLNEAATGRVVTFDREATLGDGTAFVGAYLPLVVASGGVKIE